MDNPFRYGEIATGEYFTNREREIATLSADIRSGQNVVIISPRRYGKTSLVFQVIKQLRREDVLVAYLDLFRTPNKERFADHLAEAIYTGLVAPFDRAIRHGLDLFRRLPLQPKMTVNQDGTPSFEFAPGTRTTDIDRTIEHLLALPGEIAAQRKRRVALILDEFQQVVEIDPQLPALLRAVFQTQGEVAHLFLGSKRQLMQHVFTNRNQALYRLAKPLPLHPIEPAAFRAFITARFESTGRHIMDDAVQRILDLTRGHPHDTQELCYFTWALAQAESGVVTPELVQRAVDDVLEAEGAHFTAVWEELSAHQRLVLTALAEEPGAVYAEEYRRRYRLGPSSSVQRSVARLVERELIDTTDAGRYDVTETFLRAWVRRIAVPRNPYAPERYANDVTSPAHDAPASRVFPTTATSVRGEPLADS